MNFSIIFDICSKLEFYPSIKQTLLTKALENNLPFICANPDYETIENSSDNLKICMGTIAELYKSFGGLVFMMGKPSKYIYEESIKNPEEFC